MHKVLMFGDRNWSNFEVIERQMTKLVDTHGTKNLLVISGGAPGADTMCEITAREWDVHVAVVKALWDTRHRSAGPQRNEIMRLMEPDEGIGFHEDLRKSKGTADMVKRLRRAGIPYKVVRQ